MTPKIFRSIGLTMMVSGGLIGLAFYFNVYAGLIATVATPIVLMPWATQVGKVISEERERRGRRLYTERAARSICNRVRSKDDPGVLWGKLRIPSAAAKWHFCVVGAVGSGKTLTIRMLMGDQLPLIKRGSDRRALVYDAKQDMVQIIGSMKLSCPVVVLNPFDQRAASWHMARDINSPAAARQLAESLVPKDKNEAQTFFSSAVRELLIAVVTVFLRTRPGKWTFRELLLVMKSKELLRRLLSQYDYTRETLDNFLASGETTIGNIMATAVTKMGPFEPIAAAWEHAKNKVSIEEWLKSDAILILGNDERVRSSLDLVNQLFVSIAAQQVLAMSESSKRVTWFFFDEFREAGKLPGLESIILRGRSKGCCVVLGFQDIEGVQHVYDEKLANELVGQCGNKAFLRIESPTTADWASKCIGDEEAYERGDRSETSTRQGDTTTHSVHKNTRPQVLPSEFQELPVTDTKNGLQGVYLVRSVGAYKATYHSKELTEKLGTLNEGIVPFIPGPAEWQYIRSWGPDDDKRLGLEATVQTPHGGRAHKKGHSLNDIGRLDM